MHLPFFYVLCHNLCFYDLSYSFKIFLRQRLKSICHMIFDGKPLFKEKAAKILLSSSFQPKKFCQLSSSSKHVC